MFILKGNKLLFLKVKRLIISFKYIQSTKMDKIRQTNRQQIRQVDSKLDR